jgi:hypothetical protein
MQAQLEEQGKKKEYETIWSEMYKTCNFGGFKSKTTKTTTGLKFVVLQGLEKKPTAETPT